MNILGLLHLTSLVIAKCGSAGVISQLESIVRVQSGFSTTLQCFVLPDGDFSVFWMKIPLNKAPVVIATAKAHKDAVDVYEQFKNHSRITVTWNRVTFNLSFTSVEQTDTATYICGRYEFGRYFFGNGSTLILEEEEDDDDDDNDDDKEEKHSGLDQILIPALAATNVASIFVISLLFYHLKKTKSGLTGVTSSADHDHNTDEVNYAALTFEHKRKQFVQKKVNVDPVIYGVVQTQEEL
ncbi:uncharacterized protein LOC143475683 isoform X1 [Brachyhypopomus gauderio]|uniref:uncharacterized protein LOC143475683 isoform X1 n=1 Tax=Brachyhypopomus gauderio TaxID=698409 RepID=UPI0040419611